ncbi:MAG: 3-phosphoshikimate 1-carboxyvinyltransferase [Crocinitomicaceae bacterium]|nr:3-phosphoshikimate 1-carboxyvinyltransferase [Crocinitomicaceae bacterium]
MDKFIPSSYQVEEIYPPASKSIAQRYILAAALQKKKIKLKNCGESDDVKNLLKAIVHLGSSVSMHPDYLEITPALQINKSPVHVGESGLALRLMIPVLSVLSDEFEITGSGTLLKRTIRSAEIFLNNAGLKTQSKNNFLPLHVKGNLSGGNFVLNAEDGSQFLSGLLMALPLCKKDSQIKVIGLKSKPYIDLTIDVLNHFNIKTENRNYETFIIPGNQQYQAVSDQFTIENDFSGAANWIVSGAIGKNKIRLKGLNENSLQGDAFILDAIKRCGAQSTWKDDVLEINASKELIPFEFDATDCPDLFPPLVVLAAAIKGTSKIKGISRLVNKESNRAVVLQQEFSKAGLKIDLQNDLMMIHATGTLESCTIESNNDHRIAMAAAISSQLTSHGLTVSGVECVSKSYPDFWKHLGIS